MAWDPWANPLPFTSVNVGSQSPPKPKKTGQVGCAVLPADADDIAAMVAAHKKNVAAKNSKNAKTKKAAATKKPAAVKKKSAAVKPKKKKKIGCSKCKYLTHGCARCRPPGWVDPRKPRKG
eukprot:gene11148-16752_t